MEGFVILLIVVLMILVLALRSNTVRGFRMQKEEVRKQKENLERLQRSVDQISGNLEKLISKQNRALDTEEQEVKPDSEPIVTAPEAPVPTPHLDTLVESFEEDELVEEVIEKILATEDFEEEDFTESVQNEAKASQPKIVITNRVPSSRIKEKKKSFFDKYPDIERFIGENLINKLGIVILVFGIGFLVKYAIDKNWINEAARVAVGVLSAGALIGLAHRLRKNYKSFSSVLIGGGLALLYFTITLAFHTEGYPLYEKQSLTFVILVLITLFAVFLSILYDRVEIAILAILGGFGSPLMVSTGSGNYIVLFSYLIVLNVGMLVLSYFKRWRLVNIVAFVLTVLLFGSWLSGEMMDGDTSTFAGALFYASGFYVIFFLMNVVYNIKYNLEFKAGDIALILSNTFLFFAYSMIMLADIHDGDYQGLYAVVIAIFNFGFAYYVHKREKKNSNLLYLLIGLVFTFITLAVPLQLQENYITLFWSVEAVLLLWLAQKSGFSIMKLGSLVVTGLMLISLLMDWETNYYIPYNMIEVGYEKIGLAFNKMTLTWVVSVLSFFASIWLLRKKEDNFVFRIPSEYYKWLLTAVILAVIYTGGFLELQYQFSFYFKEDTSLTIILFAFTTVYLLGLNIFAFKAQQRVIKLIASYLSILFVLVFLYTLSTSYTQAAYMFFNTAEYHLDFILMLRWVSIISVYGIAYFLFRNVNVMNEFKRNNLYKGNVAFLVFVVIYLLSSDLDVIAILISGGKEILYHTQKTGYAILWAVISFVLMIIGMRNKEQILRVLSLLLFGITIAKLFIYDISNFPEGGKIIAFILLGVLLLVISFMYQKVKRIFLDDQEKNEINEGESTDEEN